MRGKYLRKFSGLILATLLLPGAIALLSNTTAQAQRRVVIVRTYRPYYRPYYYRPAFRAYAYYRPAYRAYAYRPYYYRPYAFYRPYYRPYAYYRPYYRPAFAAYAYYPRAYYRPYRPWWGWGYRRGWR